jgi:hypothetical protein
MKFKDFLKLEDGNSQEQGLFVNLPSKETMGNAPSDGPKCAQHTKITAGARPGASMDGGLGGGMGSQEAMFMKKLMKKFMKKMGKS